MGNLLKRFKKKEIQYKSSLLDPLNDPYANNELYLNGELLEIQLKIDKILNRLDLCETKIDTLEENSQTNFKLLSKDIYHINDKLNIKPPVVI